MANIKVVAICYTTDKKVKYVSVVQNVSPQDYQKLCQDMLDYEFEKDQVVLNLKKQVEDLGHDILELKNEINKLKGID